ncbi:hypothetical protein FIE12Z_10130 [Fusarium flagelliforme]|uniref:Uncharacterized protein n=1 Tax=Fusarium flagelliforme TaxID=2675880 RepID=A0A395MCM1_9HYPO|nr:hypothetical protein FIE12Z_10130 [Fusarium flagelliforme]
MDRFSQLPTLVLTNILGELQSDKDLFNLIRASPESFRIFVRYRQTVSNLRLNRFLELDLDGTMLQDALAIINFPRLDGASHLSPPVISDSVISDWSDNLNARSFTYPQHTDSLYSFFTQLVVFIEDYLAKSLDSFPARAFMTVPTIGRVIPSMQFKGQDTDIKPASFGKMPAHTRRRLLRAFVRYELRCKLFDAQHRAPLAQSDFYEDILRQLNETLTLTECEELHCVFQYYRSVYGAVLAQCGDDHWFSDRPLPKATPTERGGDEAQPKLTSTKDFGLLFPDNTYFDWAYYRSDTFLRDWEALPCLGLDLLSAILQSPRFNNTVALRIDWWLTCLLENWVLSLWTLQDPFVRDGKLCYCEYEFPDWRRRMRDQNKAQRNISSLIKVEQKLHEYSMQNVQSQIYRRWGWIFFTDAPDQQPSLPSAAYIFEQYASVNRMADIGLQMRRRRSQKWQDYWAGRSLEDPLKSTDSTIDRDHESDRDISAFRDVPRFFQAQRFTMRRREN